MVCAAGQDWHGALLRAAPSSDKAQIAFSIFGWVLIPCRLSRAGLRCLQRATVSDNLCMMLLAILGAGNWAAGVQRQFCKSWRAAISLCQAGRGYAMLIHLAFRKAMRGPRHVCVGGPSHVRHAGAPSKGRASFAPICGGLRGRTGCLARSPITSCPSRSDKAQDPFSIFGLGCTFLAG